MAISPDQFRGTLRCFAAGVTVVTTRAGDGRDHGMTVTSFASVSVEPPLVAVVVDRARTINAALRRDGAAFAVNVLTEEQVELAERFALNKEQDRFQAGDWARAATGAPVLADALAWLDCVIEARVPAGTNTIYLGRVEDSAVPRPASRPLIYWNRAYRRVERPRVSPPAPAASS